MFATNAIFVGLFILIQTIFLATAAVSVTSVTCRGVLFDSTGQTDSQPVWPLDTCINTADSSIMYYCDENNNYAIMSERWNATDCWDGDGESDGWQTPELDVLSHGCQLMNPCPVAIVNEYVNCGSCDKNDVCEMHLPDVTVSLDQCWYDNKQSSYVKLSCEPDTTAGGWGYAVTWSKYSDDTCTTETASDTLNGANSEYCFDSSIFAGYIYFENIECKLNTPVFETECRSVTENGIIWPLDECIGTTIYDDQSGQYMEGSWKYYCKEENNELVLRKIEWKGNKICDDSTASEIEEEIPTKVLAHGCNRGKPCNFARVNELLNSKGIDGQGACWPNEQGEGNMRIELGIVTDTCVYNQDEGYYFKLKCNGNFLGDSLDYITFQDAQCSTTPTETHWTTGECLDIDVAPYLHSVECVERSSVYEYECRSVSTNYNINWAIDECFSSSAYDGNNILQTSSQMYRCDENEELYLEKYDEENCQGSSTQEIAVNITGHGCDRSKPCDLIRFDEYLNSYNNTSNQCTKNENGEGNMHVVGALVEGVCWVNEQGQYSKITCEEDSGAASGYKVNYQEFPDPNCGGTATFTQEITAGACLDIEVAPYFESIVCDLTSPVYETNCASVSEDGNAIWAMDECFWSEQNRDGTVEQKASKYVCDDNGDIWREYYDGVDNCDGTPSETVRPDDITDYNCDGDECPLAIFDEYLMSEDDNGACVKNDDTTDDNYMRIKGAIVLDTCFLNNHNDYVKVTCEADSSADFNYKLTYSNYGDSVGCAGDPDSYDEITGQECLDIPEAPYFNALSCTTGSATPAPTGFCEREDDDYKNGWLDVIEGACEFCICETDETTNAPIDQLTTILCEVWAKNVLPENMKTKFLTKCDLDCEFDDVKVASDNDFTCDCDGFSCPVPGAGKGNMVKGISLFGWIMIGFVYWMSN